MLVHTTPGMIHEHTELLASETFRGTMHGSGQRAQYYFGVGAQGKKQKG